jgi:peptidyl-prolyl cis-trans isomerase A (cyclophilin A)
LPTLIISHGFRGSPEGGGRAVRLAEAAAAYCNVVRFAFTPLGGLDEEAAELSAVIDYVRERIGPEIVLLGRSMGGCASLLAAGDGLKGIIFWSTPFDSLSAFSRALGPVNLERLKNGLSVRLDDEWGQAELSPDFYTGLIKHDLLGLLNSLKNTPLLFVYGECDELIALEEAKGSFTVRLFQDKTPLTAGNFVTLAKSGFYNGLIFHRVIDGFMIQGGAPRNASEGPGYTIKDEFVSELRHDKPGVLSMANAGPNTGGSQFFITLAPAAWLDGKHSIFGQVVAGMEVVQAIGKVRTDARDKPLEDVIIKNITIK